MKGLKKILKTELQIRSIAGDWKKPPNTHTFFAPLLLISLLSLLFFQNVARADTHSEKIAPAFWKEMEKMDFALDTQPDSALAIGYDLLKHPEVENHSETKAKIFKTMGTAHFYKACFDSALIYYTQALTLYNELADKDELIRMFNNVGIIYETIMDYDYARTNFEIALNLWNEIFDDATADDDALKMKSGICSNLGLVYDYLQKKDEALEYYTIALNLSESINDWTTIAAAQINIGSVLREKGNTDDARAYFQRALQNAAVAQQRSLLANAHISMAWLLIDLKNLNDAEKHLLEGLRLAEFAGANRFIKNACKGLAEIYQEKGEYELALHYEQRHSRLKDDIYKPQSVANIERQKHEAFINRMRESLPQEKDSFLSVNQRDVFGVVMFILGLILSYFLILTEHDSRRQRTESKGDLLEVAMQDSGTNHNEHLTENTEVENEMAEPLDIRNRKKYAASGLTDIKKLELIKAIEKIMKHRKPYLNKTFTIGMLAEMSGTGRTYLSQTINEYYKISFTKWINKYRISEALLMMKGNKRDKYSIEAISEMAGFSSKSSFYSAFKTETGTTPADFLKNQSK